MSVEDLDARCVHAEGRGGDAVADAEVSGLEPPVALCERARRAMCVYVDLASRLVEETWWRCRGPAAVRELVVAAAAWEAWVTRMVVFHKRPRMELLMLRHAGCMPGLRELDAAGLYGQQQPLSCVSTCVEVLQRCVHLTKIDLPSRRIDQATMAQLCVGFTGLSRLQTLSLSVNPLGAGGARRLAEALAHTPALERLNMTSTQLDGAAMAALEPAFAHLSQLKELDLQYNPLEADGAAVLARALCHTPSLITLTLHNAHLDAAGMAALEPALSRLSRMQVLYVHATPVGPNGAICLARALCHIPSLTRLSVDNTGIGEAGRAAIRAALPRGCRMTFEWGRETTA